MLGFGNKLLFKKDGTNYNFSGYFIHAHDGTLYSEIKSNQNMGIGRIQSNGTVVILEYDGGNIKCTVDSKDFGIIHSGLSTSLLPMIEIYEEGVIIEIEKMEE